MADRSLASVQGARFRLVRRAISDRVLRHGQTHFSPDPRALEGNGAVQEPGFGRFFEELEALARLCKPVVAERLGYHVVLSADGVTLVVPNDDGGSNSTPR